MRREGPGDGELPEGVIDADPAGGWEGVHDEESSERDAAAVDQGPDSGLQPDDPVEGEVARQGADPDLAIPSDRGEEP